MGCKLSRQSAIKMLLYCSQGHKNPLNNRFCVECGTPLGIAVGQLIENRYRIVRQLGQGGFGRTFLASDINRCEQNCVLKEFAPQQLASQLEKAKELFEREARVLYQLKHPQIPAFREMLQTQLDNQRHLFLVQDYVEGETYDQLLEARKSQGLSFSEVEVRQLLCQILPVLSYIHSLNVIHRDISPDNLIRRSADSLPVLIDFGGVKQLPVTPVFWFTQLGVIRTRLGKKGYAPEEQLRHGKAFPSSDLYALAVTALVLLTGQEPQALYDSYKGIWLWRREINIPQLEEVLKKMLADKPSDRYQSADEVLQALQLQTIASPQNSNISQMRTINFVGRKFDPNSSYSHQNSGTQVIASPIVDFSWLRPWCVRVAGLGLVVFISTGALTLLNSLSPQSMHPLQQAPSSLEKTRINVLFRRRQALAIKPRFFSVLVNEKFYQSHASARGRSLKNQPEDANMRQEWYSSAEKLLDQIEQAQLSATARSKLGSYSQQDYENWHLKANRGQLGNNTIAQLAKQTDERFYQLFPQQRDHKPNLQTFGQIWYALLSDKVSQVEIMQ